jgi:hypothetical protein
MSKLHQNISSIEIANSLKKLQARKASCSQKPKIRAKQNCFHAITKIRNPLERRKKGIVKSISCK